MGAKDPEHKAIPNQEASPRPSTKFPSNLQVPSLPSSESSSASHNHCVFDVFPSYDEGGENQFFNLEREWNGWKLKPGGSFFEDETWGKDVFNVTGNNDEDSSKPGGFF